MKRCLVTGLGLLFLMYGGSAFSGEQKIGDDLRSSLNLTFYNNGLALIKDQRRVELPIGINALNISGVPMKMIGESAEILSGGTFQIREQGFMPPNLRYAKLLEAYVGETVYLVRAHPQTGEESALEAEVISAEPNLIMRIGGRVESSPPGRIVFPEIPAGLHAAPVYRVVGDNAKKGSQDLRLQYLSGGFSWKAHHIIHVDDNAGVITLQTRATLSNSSGMDVEGSKIKLMAGDVRRMSASLAKAKNHQMRAQMSMAVADATAQRQAIGGFHLYTLKNKIDLKDGERKQVPLLRVQTIPVIREMISAAQPNAHAPLRGTPKPTHPMLRLTFENNPKTGSGQPIPGGMARLYGKDSGGAAQFLGEDHLADLPLKGIASISGGRAFDVTVSREQTDYVRQGLGRNTFEMAYRIKATNGSSREEKISVIETQNGDWQILEESMKHVRDNNRAKWTLNVPPQGTREFTYRVRVKF